MLKNWKYLILYLIAAIAVMFLFSVRTSPLYSVELGDYGGNAAATGMLMGKYWLQGVIPYKDLIALGGPLYFLIQAAGWGIAERTGILILQILNYFIFLLLVRRIMLYFCSEKAANILGVFSAFPYTALCCGGDSATEWCLALTAGLLLLVLQETENEDGNKMKLLAAGILCGGIFLSEPISGGVAYGLAVFLLLSLRGKERGKNNTGCVLAFILGIAIVCIPFFAYFAAYGCLGEVFRVMILYPLRGMTMESEPVVIIHKIVKCILVFPLLAAGIYYCIASLKSPRMIGSSGSRNKMKQEGILLIVCAVSQVLFLMLCRNEWYFYLINIPGILAALAVFVSADKRKILVLLTAGTIILTAGICFQPLKNYCYYLLDGVPEVAEEFLADLENFQKENGQCKMLFLDTDSTWYLLIDRKPEYRYFADQTNLAAWDGRIEEEKESYLARENDVIVSTEHGWTGQDFENYSLIQVYLKKRGNICIYVPIER